MRCTIGIQNITNHTYFNGNHLFNYGIMRRIFEKEKGQTYDIRRDLSWVVRLGLHHCNCNVNFALGRSAYLFYIAIFSYSLALLGYLAAKRRWKNWIGTHIGGMLGSYIGIVTATLVVNATDIPFLNELPILTVWFLPTMIGTPIIFIIGKRYAPRNQ